MNFKIHACLIFRDGGSSYVRFSKEHLYTTFFVANDNTRQYNESYIGTMFVIWVQYINSSNETQDNTIKVLVHNYMNH